MQLAKALASARTAALPVALGAVFGCDARRERRHRPQDRPSPAHRHLVQDHQQALQDVTIATVVGGALWFGSENRTARSFWQAVDSTVLGAATAAVVKPVFSRARPSQTERIPATGSKAMVTTASRVGKLCW